MMGADIICSITLWDGSPPTATTLRTISVSVTIPTISLPRLTNKLPIFRSRIISAAFRTSVSRSTVTNFSAGTMKDLTGTMRDLPMYGGWQLMEIVNNRVNQCRNGILIRHNRHRQPFFLGGLRRDRANAGDRDARCQRAHLISAFEQRAKIAHGGRAGKGHDVQLAPC